VSSAIDSLLLFSPEPTEVDQSEPDRPYPRGYSDRVSVSVRVNTSAQAVTVSDPEALRRSLAELHNVCCAVEERLVRAEGVLLRTEALASDRTLLDLCRRIDARIGRSEHNFQALQKAVADLDRRLANIDEATHDTERLAGDRLCEEWSSETMRPPAQLDANQAAHDLWIALTRCAPALYAATRSTRIVLLLGIVAMLTLVGSPVQLTPARVLQIPPAPGPVIAVPAPASAAMDGPVVRLTSR
jgi:hypothetical protein